MSHLLPLVSSDYHGYWTGKSGPFQVFMGFLFPGIILIRFTHEGIVAGAEDRSFSPDLLVERAYHSFDPSMHPEAVRPKGFPRLKQWQDEIGFREQPILIQPFSLLPRYPVGVDIVPYWVHDAIAHPANYLLEEVEAAHEMLTNWRHGFGYALNWEGEYLMDSDGTILGT
jgi:hypothetical protein